MTTTKEIFQIIKDDIATHHIILFMKGDREIPQCGFSGGAIEILQRCNVEFVTRNVLLDDALRQGIKEFSDWPTIPQLYVNGEFIGGFDIMQQLFATNELPNILATT